MTDTNSIGIGSKVKYKKGWITKYTKETSGLFGPLYSPAEARRTGVVVHLADWQDIGTVVTVNWNDGRTSQVNVNILTLTK